MAQTAQMNCIASNLELKTHEVSARERKSIACTAPLNTEKIVFRLKVVIIFSINGILEVCLLRSLSLLWLLNRSQTLSRNNASRFFRCTPNLIWFQTNRLLLSHFLHVCDKTFYHDLLPFFHPIIHFADRKNRKKIKGICAVLPNQSIEECSTFTAADDWSLQLALFQPDRG